MSTHYQAFHAWLLSFRPSGTKVSFLMLTQLRGHGMPGYPHCVPTGQSSAGPASAQSSTVFLANSHRVDAVRLAKHARLR